jgi:hypothetical protein
LHRASHTGYGDGRRRNRDGDHRDAWFDGAASFEEDPADLNASSVAGGFSGNSAAHAAGCTAFPNAYRSSGCGCIVGSRGGMLERIAYADGQRLRNDYRNFRKREPLGYNNGDGELDGRLILAGRLETRIITRKRQHENKGRTPLDRCTAFLLLPASIDLSWCCGTAFCS